MKIKLTLEEVTKIIINHFNLPQDTELVIAKKITLIDSQLREIEKLDYKGVEKIPAIKKLREFAHDMMLAECKWAVENWGVFSSFCRKNNRWPKFKSLYDTTGKYDYILV